MRHLRCITLVSLAIICGCTRGGSSNPTTSPQTIRSAETDSNSPLTKATIAVKLASPVIVDGQPIDPKYTDDGADVSPPLAWTDVPDETQSFAIICDDPDAPSPKRPAPHPWVHWVIFNIPASTNELPEGIERTPEPRQVPGARQGRNSWPSDNLGYRGPAPPPGSGRHRYFFRIFAIDQTLNLDPGITKDQLLAAIQGHVLAEGHLMGTYER